jgi:hypothetical protein
MLVTGRCVSEALDSILVMILTMLSGMMQELDDLLVGLGNGRYELVDDDEDL